MRWRDLLWALAYPIYQVIGTFRHESAHALAALMTGGVIEEFVILPTQGYWGYVSWEGPKDVFNIGAPYLLDLLTFLVFFTLCMRYPFGRRWIWLNLVILGIVSPLINSAYNYSSDPSKMYDVGFLLQGGEAPLVHAYFIFTLSLYALGLFLVFTRARIHQERSASAVRWTVIPVLTGSFVLLAAGGGTLVESRAVDSVHATSTEESVELPPPAVLSATMTPTLPPGEIYDAIFEYVVSYVAQEYPLRAPIGDLEWEGGYRVGSQDPDTMVGEFFAGDWKYRLFDWDRDDPMKPVDVYINNQNSVFNWSGTATMHTIAGQLNSAGLVPKSTPNTGEWLVYTNERYGYQFHYPADVDVFEHGVSWVDDRDVPEGMDPIDAKKELVRELGPNLCVKVVLGEGYIWFDPPENFGARFNFCGRLGPGAMGWSYEPRAEIINIEGYEHNLEGSKLINLEDDHYDEALRLKMPSGLHIEVGAYTQNEEAYQRYRKDVLPILLAILETYKSIPRLTGP